MPNQIAFYPQSSGGGAGSVTLIQKQVLASPAATVIFSAIPQTYTHLKLVVEANSSSASVDNLSVQLNNDTATNYHTQFLSVTGANPPAGSVAATTSGLLGNVQSSAQANRAGATEVTLFNYVATAFTKMFVGNSFSVTTTGNTTLIVSAVEWTGTAAVSTLTLLLSSGSNFGANSVFSLYGLQ